MDAKEIRIMEIMNEFNFDHDVAESLFVDEILEKYDTDNIDIAETMFYADAED